MRGLVWLERLNLRVMCVVVCVCVSVSCGRAPVTFLFSHGNAEGEQVKDCCGTVDGNADVHGAMCPDLGMIYEWFADFSRQLNVGY